MVTEVVAEVVVAASAIEVVVEVAVAALVIEVVEVSSIPVLRLGFHLMRYATLAIGLLILLFFVQAVVMEASVTEAVAVAVVEAGAALAIEAVVVALEAARGVVVEVLPVVLEVVPRSSL